MVIGGMAFLLMMMTNWIALDYAYYGKGKPTSAKTYTTKNAMWVQVILSWLAGLLYCLSIFAPRFQN
jgi:hypothetical protein